MQTLPSYRTNLPIIIPSLCLGKNAHVAAHASEEASSDLLHMDKR
jgi:hypothetical protein